MGSGGSAIAKSKSKVRRQIEEVKPISGRPRRRVPLMLFTSSI
jgi:hypothetical protein